MIREATIVLWMILTAPALGQFLVEQPPDAEVTALKAQPAPAAPSTKVARVISAVGCKSCPLIRSWLVPSLLRDGYTVESETHSAYQPGKIYPYVEMETCTGTTCSRYTIMVPDKRTPFTPEWFKSQVRKEGPEPNRFAVPPKVTPGQLAYAEYCMDPTLGQRLPSWDALPDKERWERIGKASYAALIGDSMMIRDNGALKVGLIESMTEGQRLIRVTPP